MASSESLLLREQYGEPQTQRDASTFGMWIFLATEVMFFGGLFAAFATYRMYYTPGFLVGSREMTLKIGSVNTVILITSSLTMTLAIKAISEDKKVRSYVLQLVTIFIGFVFLSLKFTEYIRHYQDHKVPGIWFESHSVYAQSEELFFIFYFILTGLHVIHLTVGIGLATTMAVRTALGRFSAAYFTPIAVVGLYWHFVDIIWNFLFAILYVPGLH